MLAIPYISAVLGCLEYLFVQKVQVISPDKPRGPKTYRMAQMFDGGKF